MNVEQIAEWLTNTLKSIVDSPEEVKVENRTDDMGVLLTVSASKNDMGLIIGRSGSTIQAIRVVVRALGSKLDQRVNVKLDEPAYEDRNA